MKAAARRAWIWPVIVAAIGGSVYLNALPNEFALDDVPLVRDNPDVQSETPLELVLRPYWGERGAASGLYRPVTMLSLNLTRRAFGSGPAGFHAVNVALHMLVCVLVWYVARGAGLHYGTAFATGLLFAVHPVHTEAVANIMGRAELLGAAAALAAWLAYRGGRLVPAALFYLLALLSKENTVLLPLVFLLEGLWRSRDEAAGAWKRLLPGVAAFASALVLGLVMRLAALGGLRGTSTVAFIDNPAAFAGAWVRLGTALWVQVKYALLFVWPFGLSSDYSFDAVPDVTSWLDPRLAAGVAWAAGLAVAFALAVRRARPVALGIAVWVVAFLPSSNLLFVSGTIMAERLAYLPSLGGCLILGHLIARRRGSRMVIAGTLVALLALSWGTVRRNPDWEGNAALALRDVQAQPRSAKLHAGAGIVLHDRGELDAAAAAYREALAIYPDYAQIHYNMGELLLVLDRTEEAIGHLRTAAGLAPANPRPHKTLAPLLERAGSRREALLHYEAGSRIDPRDLVFRFDYGRFLLRLGQTRPAREVFASLERDDRSGFPGRVARAIVDELDGELERAVAQYRELLADPALPPGIRAGVARRLEASTSARE